MALAVAYAWAKEQYTATSATGQLNALLGPYGWLISTGEMTGTCELGVEPLPGGTSPSSFVCDFVPGKSTNGIVVVGVLHIEATTLVT